MEERKRRKGIRVENVQLLIKNTRDLAQKTKPKSREESEDENENEEEIKMSIEQKKMEEIREKKEHFRREQGKRALKKEKDMKGE